MEVGTLRSDLEPLFEHLNGVLEIGLHHAETAHQKDDVGIPGGQLTRFQQQFEGL